MSERTSAEVYESFYGHRPETPQTWQELWEVIHTNAHILSTDLFTGIGLADKDIHTILINSGAHLQEQLPQEMQELTSMLIEQTAAKELREKFGKPQSLLAVPVFLQLAENEVEAQSQTKSLAPNMLEIVTGLTKQITLSLQLFVAEQVEVVEAEITTHQTALNQSRQITNQSEGNLQQEFFPFQTKFDQKEKELQTKRGSLRALWRRVVGGIENLTQHTIQVVEPLAQQIIAPTPLAA